MRRKSQPIVEKSLSVQRRRPKKSGNGLEVLTLELMVTIAVLKKPIQLCYRSLELLIRH